MLDTSNGSRSVTVWYANVLNLIILRAPHRFWHVFRIYTVAPVLLRRGILRNASRVLMVQDFKEISSRHAPTR